MNEFVYVSDSKVRKDLSSNLAKPGDLVFTQRGTLGQVAVIPDEGLSDSYVVSQSQMKLTVDGTKADRFFLYYYFSSREAIERITNFVSSSGVPHINLTTLRSFEVPVPPLDIQKKIAAILSAYDDLIENNRRRIQLLEQAAQLLYREWFVRLRFPGHEHVRIKDGVPEGWEKKPLGDLLTLQRGFDLPANDREEGPYPIYASTGINGFHKVAKVVGPGVVTGRSGSLGTVMYVPGDFWPLNTALWVKEFKRVSPLFALHLLSGMKLEQYNGGAAVPTLNRNDVHRVETLCPSRNIMRLFDDCINPLYLQIETLERSIKLLAQARDLLLPRLMNGDFGYEQR
ncbi:MAG: restriction endonuclease subunit S [Methanothrix sp.]|jgi:type I restriction enzyme S subunit|nr:restriction endonuclease subunit S [Methanothrix sp.]